MRVIAIKYNNKKKETFKINENAIDIKINNTYAKIKHKNQRKIKQYLIIENLEISWILTYREHSCL